MRRCLDEGAPIIGYQARGADEDDTIVIVHYSSSGVSLLRMNLQDAHSHMNDEGKVINDFLRKKSSDTGTNSLLSGELFFMYGDLYRYVTN